MVKSLKKIEGIVIRSIDYGEANKIVTIFSKEGGKLGMMARGAKKPNSRLSSVSELFTYGSYLFRSSSGLGTMTQGEVVHSFRTIREDLFKTAYTAYIAEITEKLTDEKQPNSQLFHLLYHSLRYINEDYDAEVIAFIYALKMLVYAGLAPQVNYCVRCQNEKRPYSFSIKEGGFLCARCENVDRYRIPLSDATQRLLPLFFKIEITQIGTISLKEKTKQEIRTVLHHYYDTYSGLFLKSRRFLDQLHRIDRIDI